MKVFIRCNKAPGHYEKETDSTGNVRELYYISGSDSVVAALQRMNEKDSIFYIHKDQPGSFDVITNPDGTVKERYNYNPCFVRRSVAKAEGRRRNAADWSYNNIEETSFLDRGFTGHEHGDQFGLINMLSEAKSRSLQASGNGRVYDPLMAMFLSPDNFVQSSDLTQNLNRYTYCLNNPLKYFDPGGMTYYKLEGNEWIAFEYNPFSGGDPDFRIASGGGICIDNSPDFETFMASKGYLYATNEYGIGAWIPKSERTEITWLYFAGTKDNPYQSFTGYDTSDGTKVRFFNNPSGQEGGGSKAAWNVVSTTIGVLGTSSDIAKESGYVTTIGTNLKPYASGWAGNQYVKTMGIAKGASTVFFLAGAGADVYMYSQGYQSGAKTLTNLGVSGTAIYLGGIPGIILGGGYMLIDKTVGWDRVMTPASNDQWVPNRVVFPDGTTISVCFKAGTQILAKEGLKPIEQIVVGDSVYSYNIEKSTIELSKVVKSFERKTQVIYELTTDNQKIYVTAEHPFYVIGNGWIKVKDLKAGAVLKTKNGSIEHITSSVLEKHPETVYNIEVERNHNYFVTNSNILVHNK